MVYEARFARHTSNCCVRHHLCHFLKQSSHFINTQKFSETNHQNDHNNLCIILFHDVWQYINGCSGVLWESCDGQKWFCKVPSPPQKKIIFLITPNDFLQNSRANPPHIIHHQHKTKIKTHYEGLLKIFVFFFFIM